MYQGPFYPAVDPAQHHSRHQSVSTATSSRSASPFVYSNTTFPYIAPSEQSPTASHFFGFDPYLQNKNFDDAFNTYTEYIPSALSTFQSMSIDQAPTANLEDVPNLLPSRTSTASHGQDTPSTPQLGGSEEHDDRAAKVTTDYPRPPVELFRSESAVYQDELFNPDQYNSSNPAATSASTAPQRNSPKNSVLSNLVESRLRTANSARNNLSPSQQQVNRERSPFRKGSELAPPSDFHPSPGSVMPTAARQRQQQKEQADQKEFDAHKPLLRREPTKTISPKDALLDAPDYDRSSTSLFSDVIPQGYQRHLGASQAFPTNFVSGTNQAFGQFVPMASSNMGGFRHGGGVDLNNFLASPLTTGVNGFPTFPSSTQKSDPTPEYPAQLTSMESSKSDNHMMSSQDSAHSPPMKIKRPADTSASSGTYACTAAGCLQRFESAAKLQKHKRDAHPLTPADKRKSVTPASSMAETSATSTGANNTDDEGADDDEDDDGSHNDNDSLGSGMTSSELLARNSQTGPHKCTRTNPTTGKPCNTVFSRPYDLTRHEDTIHNRVKQKVRCQYCTEEKSFSRNDALTRHMRVVHPDIEFQGKRGSMGR